MQKILVIEDESDMLAELRDLLIYERFVVLSASNGEAGWQLIQADPPDLILCNIRMPGIDGFELLERLRRHPACTLIPFIFLTARATPDDLRRAMNLGADDYLIKPIHSSELLSAVRARLQRYETIRRHHKDAFGLHERVLLHYFPHELFTPLNALLGVSRVLKRQSHKLAPDRLLQLAEVMLRNGSRLYHLLQNQLLYLEMESSSFEQPSTANLKLALEPQVALIARERAEYYKRQADLQLHLEDGEIRMLEKHFQVVARELIDNAFKFSEPGTPVIASTRRLEGDWQQLKVVNAGSGMTPDQIEQIGAFTQFDRAHREQQGIGLGLMLTQRLLHHYGYPMEIDSVPGRYTQVEVKFQVTGEEVGSR
ncbi:MAG TPA: response regulator [Candidatus Obscuribacterales bacterium]